MMRTDHIKTFLGLIIVVSFLWTIFMIKISNSVNFDADHLDSEYAMDNKHSLTTMTILDTVKNARVCQGDTLSVCYKIVNTGSDSLFLYRINPDCTCSDYSISSRSVSSGDTISLLLQVATDNKFDNNYATLIYYNDVKINDSDFTFIPDVIENAELPLEEEKRKKPKLMITKVYLCLKVPTG